MIEQALRLRLVANAAISALVGTKVYCGYAPQALPGVDPYPYLLITLVSETPGHNLDGYDGHTAARLQVDAITRTYTQAKQIQEALRNCLDGYRGTIVVGANSFEIGHCFVSSVAEMLEQGDVGSEDWLHRIMTDLILGTRQAAPTSL